MNLEVDDVTLEEAVAIAMDYIRRGERCRVVTPNGEFAMAADKNPAFLEAINTAQLVLPDGISVVLAAKIIGNPLKGKVAGVDFAAALCKAMGCEGKSLYILGAQPGVAEKAAKALAEVNPGLVIAGTHHGFFEKDEEVVPAIAQARPDALFLAMGAPRSELFAVAHGQQMGAGVMAGVGGTIDIFAGNSTRAPDVFIRLGLEWLYRLAKEPWRIKRMIKLPVYLMQAVLWRIRHGSAGKNH